MKKLVSVAIFAALLFSVSVGAFAAPTGADDVAVDLTDLWNVNPVDDSISAPTGYTDSWFYVVIQMFVRVKDKISDVISSINSVKTSVHSDFQSLVTGWSMSSIDSSINDYASGFGNSWFWRILHQVNNSALSAFATMQELTGTGGGGNSSLGINWNIKQIKSIGDTISGYLSDIKTVIASNNAVTAHNNQSSNASAVVSGFLSGTSSGSSLGVSDFNGVKDVVSDTTTMFSSPASLSQAGSAFDTAFGDGGSMFGFFSQSVSDELNGESTSLRNRRNNDDLPYFNAERAKVNNWLGGGPYG